MWELLRPSMVLPQIILLMVAAAAPASDSPRRWALKVDESWDLPSKPLEERLLVAAGGGHDDAVEAFIRHGAKINRRGIVRRASQALPL